VARPGSGATANGATLDDTPRDDVCARVRGTTVEEEEDDDDDDVSMFLRL
jgi:hypothetical protein